MHRHNKNCGNSVEYDICHAHSSYWERSEEDKLKDFQKVAPYLTYLDFNQLEAATRDVQTKLGALEYENLNLKAQIAEPFWIYGYRFRRTR